MFHDIPQEITDRMRFLECMDADDRNAGKPSLERLRQVPPLTGRFLAVLAASAPAGTYIEIGTSGGYSGLWTSLALRATGRKLTTFEVLDAKVKLATETFRVAGVADIIEIVQGDARDHLANYTDVSYCFLDAEKDTYQDCFDLVVPNMVPGGILAADNVISHEDVLRPMIDQSIADERVDALVVPIGSGVLLCRRI